MSQVESLQARGAQVFIHDTARVDLTQALETLHSLGVQRLMVEGGGTLNFEIIRLGLVDEIILYVAPLIFGGAEAPTLADGLGLARSGAVALKLMNVETREDGGVLLRYKL
jgi:2,5-diamino-6-(ribosylamino)-4(3H)-pyrimidinone 5'-phosphate reductase